MRVVFEFSFSDLIDSHIRLVGRDVLRENFWKGAASSAFYYGLCSLVFPAFLFPNWSDGWKLLIFLIAALLGAVLHMLFYRKGLRDSLTKCLREYMKEGERAVCEVELNEDGMLIAQFNTRSTYAWKEIKQVRETDDAVEIYMHKRGGGVIIRRRAFSSLDEARHFVETLKNKSDAR